MTFVQRCAMAILWPAFLMAGVLEVLVFALVDPHQMRWLGSSPLDWPAAAIYTIAFFVFWAVTTVTAALALMLDLPADRINRP